MMDIFSSKKHTRKQIPIIILLLISLTYLGSTSSQIEILTETTMRNIFQQNQLIVIYVCEQKDSQTYKTFSQYCSQHACAYLDKQNELYDNVRDFVGYPHQNYFLILDSPRQLKYVLQIKGTVQYNDIDSFVQDFNSKKLTPYFTSQQEPTQNYESCRKLVGVNFDKFMALEAPIKVVYLYIDHESCEVCDEMLRGFSDIAEKLYREDVIAFGYFDIFKNDHPLITSQVAPFFLVFVQGETQPYGIQGEKFPQLEKALINIIAEHIYPDYRKDHEQNQEYTQVDIEGIEDLETFDQEKFEQPNNNRNVQL